MHRLGMLNPLHLQLKVGTNGRLVLEAFLVFIEYDGTDKGKDACQRIDTAFNEGLIPSDTRSKLHDLRLNANKGVHYATKPFKPEDKPIVAHAVYHIATMFWRIIDDEDEDDD